MESLASWDSKSHLRQYLIGNVSYLSLNAWFLNMLMCPAMVSCSTFIEPAGLTTSAHDKLAGYILFPWSGATLGAPWGSWIFMT